VANQKIKRNPCLVGSQLLCVHSYIMLFAVTSNWDIQVKIFLSKGKNYIVWSLAEPRSRVFGDDGDGGGFGNGILMVMMWNRLEATFPCVGNSNNAVVSSTTQNF